MEKKRSLFFSILGPTIGSREAMQVAIGCSHSYQRWSEVRWEGAGGEIGDRVHGPVGCYHVSQSSPYVLVCIVVLTKECSDSALYFCSDFYGFVKFM